MVPASVVTTIWPPLTGKSSVVLAVAGAMAATVMPACLRAADIAGLTTTSVLLPMTVARAERYLAVAGGLGGVPPLFAAGLPAEVWPPPPQAATTNPAAASTAISGCREQLRSKPISLLLRLAGCEGVEVAGDVAVVECVADDGGGAPDRACGGVGEQ